MPNAAVLAFALLASADPTPPPAATSTSTTKGAFKPLHSDGATASSYLANNWNKHTENYHPNYVLDDDPKTAWVEGAEGDGVGESVTIPLSALGSARAVRVEVRNGYQKSKDLHTANAM